jgi:hypothetical protein
VSRSRSAFAFTLPSLLVMGFDMVLERILLLGLIGVLMLIPWARDARRLYAPFRQSSRAKLRAPAEPAPRGRHPDPQAPGDDLHGQLLDQVQALYERIWSGGECGACKLRDDCPGPLADFADNSRA